MTMMRGELLRLSDAAGCTLRVQAGRLWVTEEDAGVDHIVEPGQAFTAGKGGATVVSALKPSAFRKSSTPVGDGAFRRLAGKVDLELLARFAKADCHGRTGHFDCSAMDWFLERARALGVEHRAPPPLLLGRHLIDLGVTPGPGMGRILKAVYERQLDGEVATLDEALAAARAALGVPGVDTEERR